jgi:hypothetical protein
MSRCFRNLGIISCESWYAWSICIAKCSISWNIWWIYQIFWPSWRMLIQHQGLAFHSVKKRFPCVTRVSRALAATMKRPAAPAVGARCTPPKPWKLVKERACVNTT